jgi:hypothetical protein
LLNLIPTKVVLNVTLVEKWSGRKPLIRHLRNFECIAHAYILDEIMKKLDAKCHACIMMCYSKEFKAYKLFDSIKEEIICRRNVIFD